MTRCNTTKNRPNGISSRLRRGKGTRSKWIAPNGQVVQLPLVLDILNIDEGSGEASWFVEAQVDLIADQPELTDVQLKGHPLLDANYLQVFFRWATPIDVVTRIVPNLLEQGIDPFKHEYATTGYPDSYDPARKVNTRLSDEFLEEIVQQYLAIGRGYARTIATERGVTTRTVVSWVEKARKRGILSDTKPGKSGGSFLSRKSERRDGDNDFT